MEVHRHSVGLHCSAAEDKATSIARPCAPTTTETKSKSKAASTTTNPRAPTTAETKGKSKAASTACHVESLDCAKNTSAPRKDASAQETTLTGRKSDGHKNRMTSRTNPGSAPKGHVNAAVSAPRVAAFRRNTSCWYASFHDTGAHSS